MGWGVEGGRGRVTERWCAHWFGASVCGGLGACAGGVRGRVVVCLSASDDHFGRPRLTLSRVSLSVCLSVSSVYRQREEQRNLRVQLLLHLPRLFGGKARERLGRDRARRDVGDDLARAHAPGFPVR